MDTSNVCTIGGRRFLEGGPSVGPETVLVVLHTDGASRRPDVLFEGSGIRGL
jgi:hypothetical protein